MKKAYVVDVKEVHVQPYFIEAESEEDAIAKVKDGDGIMMEDSMYFAYTLDGDVWNVRDADNSEIEDFGEV